MLKPITAFVPKKLTVIDRLIIKLGDSQQSSLCILQEQLPQIFRITAIEATLLTDSTYEINASIFHVKAQLDVQWNASQLDSRLSINQLVSIRWKGKLYESSGKIIISRLAPIEAPYESVNLLDTLPTAWCQNREEIQRLGKVVDLLSSNYKKVFNTIFWNSNTFYGLISSPSYISTIERCERVMKFEYKFFIDTEQTVLMLLINAISKQSISEVIIDQIVLANTMEKHGVKSEFWSTLLLSLDY
ncbi:MAG: hypothetical protein CTY32_04310 [Methylotenera sp.]|nr:MAG: hypothetical protein CTY32_04310 [Methylotenera sp.]